MKLKKVFAALVLSTGQETVPVPLVEWLEYSQELQKISKYWGFPLHKETIIQEYNYHQTDFG